MCVTPLAVNRKCTGIAIDRNRARWSGYVRQRSFASSFTRPACAYGFFSSPLWPRLPFRARNASSSPVPAAQCPVVWMLRRRSSRGGDVDGHRSSDAGETGTRARDFDAAERHIRAITKFVGFICHRRT